MSAHSHNLFHGWEGRNIAPSYCSRLKNIMLAFFVLLSVVVRLSDCRQHNTINYLLSLSSSCLLVYTTHTARTDSTSSAPHHITTHHITTHHITTHHITTHHITTHHITTHHITSHRIHTQYTTHTHNAHHIGTRSVSNVHIITGPSHGINFIQLITPRPKL